MALKPCDYPGCKSAASLMKCYRCGKNAACEQHSRKEPSLGGRYICFACAAEIDEVARQKAEKERLARFEEKGRQIDAKRKEQDRLAQYTVICPVCQGTGGWEGTEDRKIIKKEHHPAGYTYDEAGTKNHYREYDSVFEQNEESVSYFEKCYLCNTSDGVPGKITPSMYSYVKYQGLTHECPRCAGSRPKRRNAIVTYGRVTKWDSGPDTYAETSREEKPVLSNICNLCGGKKLVNEKVFTAFSQGGIQKASMTLKSQLPTVSIDRKWLLHAFMMIVAVLFVIALFFLPRIWGWLFSN